MVFAWSAAECQCRVKDIVIMNRTEMASPGVRISAWSPAQSGAREGTTTRCLRRAGRPDRRPQDAVSRRNEIYCSRKRMLSVRASSCPPRTLQRGTIIIITVHRNGYPSPFAFRQLQSLQGQGTLLRRKCDICPAPSHGTRVRCAPPNRARGTGRAEPQRAAAASHQRQADRAACA